MIIRNETKFVIAVLAVTTLAQSALSAGTDTPTSYAPQTHSSSHVYGSPIQPAVVGRAKTSHQQHIQKKRSSKTSNRNAQ
jgi:hypothetical protein